MSIFSRHGEMAISEAELSSMTAELDMLHNETFPTVRKTVGDIAANLSHLRTTDGLGRRGFLAGVGGVAVVGGLAACSSSGGGNNPSGSNSPSGTSTAGGNSKYTGDYKVVALAAALENLAVAAYGMAASAAGAGKLGTVPKAVVQFITVASAQHRDHAGAWNAVLKSADLDQVKDAPLTITAPSVAALKKVDSVPGVAKLALGLENAAAETYTYATANVSDKGGIAVASTIAPVEAMHAAILNFVLGNYPVPASFLGTKDAVHPDALTI